MFVPLGDRVLVRVHQAKTQTESGLMLAPDAVEVPETGDVLSVGPLVQVVKPGDIVIYPKWSGTEVKAGTVFREAEIIGIERPD